MTFTYTPLEQRRVLSLAGPDSLTFLQGQSTCDVQLLSESLSLCGALCTPQGRLLADFRLLEAGPEQYLLVTHSSIADNTVAVLGKYIVFSKAEIATSDNWAIIGLQGSGCEAFISSYFGHCPSLTHEQVSHDNVHVVCLGGQVPRFECYINAAAETEFMSGLQSSASKATQEQWLATEIEAGWAHIEETTLELFIPQMLNYQATGLINFTKGCYTGQEVVARTQYRGKLKRRLYYATAPSGVEAPGGTPLYGSDPQQSIGNIVNSACRGDQLELLAVISNTAIEQDVHIGSPSGPSLVVGELPYSLEQD